MYSPKTEPRSPRAVDVKVSRQSLAVELADGRTLVIPIAWYPRLFHGTPSERTNWRLIGGREGIHWPELDEDVSIDGLLAGHPSGESQASPKRWLTQRELTHNKALQGRPARGRSEINRAHNDALAAAERQR